MGRRDNLKIFTTAILVVLLFSSFIFAFIYRNEIVQKLQTVGKTGDVDRGEREIVKPADKNEVYTPETLVTTPKDGVNPNLPELPNLEDMEPDLDKSRSVSVTGAQKKTESQTKSLKEKIDRIEESIEPKPKETKTTTKETMDAKETPKAATSEEIATTPTSGKKISDPVKLQKINTSSKQLSDGKKKKVKSTKMVSSTSYKKTKEPKPSKSSKMNVNYESRLAAVEGKLKSNDERNEKRFSEIERRIESLEKALNQK
ncbi:hypothetical protein P3G55_06140 [Leptospira sp. 96542]|nr:hypothetical protein [Leptospira sp. 96542]